VHGDRLVCDFATERNRDFEIASATGKSFAVQLAKGAEAAVIMMGACWNATREKVSHFFESNPKPPANPLM